MRMKSEVLRALPIAILGILLSSLFEIVSEVVGYLAPESPFFWLHFTMVGYVAPGLLAGIVVGACMVACSRIEGLLISCIPLVGVVGFDIIFFGVALSGFQPFHAHNLFSMWLPRWMSLVVGCILGAMIVRSLKRRRHRREKSEQCAAAYRR